MTLLGRDQLLTWSAAAWRDARRGRGRLLLVSGEAGIGKTTLARAIVDLAEADGATVRWGSCWDGGRVPLTAWIDALRLPGGDACAQVAAGLAEARLDERAAAASADHAHGRLVADVVDALRAAAREQPQVLVLDDVHWADGTSLVLLRALAAHLPTMAVLTVATYRDDELPPASPLAELTGGAERLQLAGLDETAVGALLAAVLGRDPTTQERHDVHLRTAGNPLFVTHVGRLLDSGSSAAVPEGIADVLARRLARLPSGCDRVLGAAAVLGQEFDVSIAATMLGCSVDEALGALDHAEVARVASPSDAAGLRWRFAHALIQASRYGALGSVARADLHRRAFDALAAASTTPAAVLAHHAASGRFDLTDTRPATAMLAAGDEAAARLAGDDALAHYEDALAHAPAGPDGEVVKARAMLGLGRARLRRGDVKGAGDAFETAAAIARALGDAELLAHAALGFGAGLGGFEVRMLDRRQADLLEEAAAALGASSPLRPWVLARLSCALTMLGSEARRLALAEAALEAARRSGDAAAVAAALAGWCDVVAGPTHVDERAAASAEIIAIGEQLADRGLELLGRRLRILTLAERCDHRELDAEIARFERSATLLGDPLYTWYVPLWHAMRALCEGKLDDARALAAEARDTGTSAGSDNARVLPLVVELYVAVAAGDPDELRRLGTMLIRDMPSLLLSNGTPMLLWMDVLFGATDGAARTRQLVEDLDRSLAFDAEWLGAMAPLADLAVDLGLDDLAPALYARLLPFAHLAAIEGIAAAHRGPVARWLALLAARMGDARATKQHVDDALALAAGAGALVLADVQFAAAIALRMLDTAEAAARAEQLASDAARTRHALGLPPPLRIARDPHPDTRPPDPGTASLVRQGDAWVATWHGHAVQIRHAKGVADLAQLLGHAGREIHVRELEGVTAAPAPRPRDDALDATALAQYRSRLRELDADLDDAERDNDSGRAALLAAERDALVAELTRSVGLGGRARRAGADPDERLRKAVSARVRAVIDRIERLHPPLGRHLRSSVRTGFWCSYQPEQATTWRIER
jgi:hypothetical protein